MTGGWHQRTKTGAPFLKIPDFFFFFFPPNLENHDFQQDCLFWGSDDDAAKPWETCK